MSKAKATRSEILAVRAFFGVLGAVAPRTAGRVASRLFVRPRRHHVPRREQRWLKGSRRRDVNVERHTIATYAWGDGPVVLLLHGWEGRGAQLGAFAGPLVQAGFRPVAVDLPAHGRSSGKTTDGFTCGRVVAALCQEIAGVHGVVAHSFGASSALIAMAYGLTVERAVLIGPGIKGDTIFSGFARIVGLPDRATDELRRVIYERFGREDWSLFTPERLGEVLGERAQAALVVHDHGDDEVDHAESVEFARLTKGARMLSTRGMGHYRILRDERVVREVVAFVRG